MEGIQIDVGNRRPIVRVPTGLYSLDLALSEKGKLGVPNATLFEIAGKTGVGKSTSSYFISGALAKNGSKTDQIEVVDLEGLDVDYLSQAIGVSGFRGKVHLVDDVIKGRIRSHTDMITESADAIGKNENIRVVILDSVGAFIPDSEAGGDIGEANMGRRAFALGQWARRCVNFMNVREKPINVIYINHTHSVLAGQGHITAGGDTLQYLSAVRITLWQKEAVKSGEDIIGYRVGGQVEKLRYGGKGRKFELVIVPSYGVSRELTALYDAANLELIDRGSVVKVDGKSIGYISKLFEAAVTGNTSKFDPIFEKLEKEKNKNVLGNPGLYEEIESDEN